MRSYALVKSSVVRGIYYPHTKRYGYLKESEDDSKSFFQKAGRAHVIFKFEDLIEKKICFTFWDKVYGGSFENQRLYSRRDTLWGDFMFIVLSMPQSEVPYLNTVARRFQHKAVKGTYLWCRQNVPLPLPLPHTNDDFHILRPVNHQ